MQSQGAEVRIAAVEAVACWARATGQAFAPFYSPIVPLLLSSAQSPDDQLNEAYLEAATIIGQAVPDLFAADAHRIMDSIIPSLQDKAYMLPSCARIASVLGESYMPYLSQPSCSRGLARRMMWKCPKVILHRSDHGTKWGRPLCPFLERD